jgi:DNA phosphorothioation-dependent restriction protein DptG
MNKNETIADIRKEAEARFRELLEKHVDSLGHIQAMQQFNQAFDRIEAARRREARTTRSAAGRIRPTAAAFAWGFQP